MTVVCCAGDFKFDSIGSPYPANIPVVALRLVPAISGAFLLPTAYHVMLELGLSQWTGALAGFLLLCGTSLFYRCFINSFIVIFS